MSPDAVFSAFSLLIEAPVSSKAGIPSSGSPTLLHAAASPTPADTRTADTSSQVPLSALPEGFRPSRIRRPRPICLRRFGSQSFFPHYSSRQISPGPDPFFLQLVRQTLRPVCPLMKIKLLFHRRSDRRLSVLCFPPASIPMRNMPNGSLPQPATTASADISRSSSQ